VRIGAREAQRRQRIDGGIDSRDAPLQYGEEVARADLLAAQQIDDRAGVRAKEIGIDCRPLRPSQNARGKL
jgi:hypothetical protein